MQITPQPLREAANHFITPPTDIGVLRTRHHTSGLVAVGTYGVPTGYSSLDNAVKAMRYLTTGAERKGVAIFEQNGRFVAQRVLEMISDARFKTGMRAAYLNIEGASNLRLMPFLQHPDLRALVDGPKVLYSKLS